MGFLGTFPKKTKSFNIVGPVCESADFLNKNAILPHDVSRNQNIILWDVGAYCHVLSSNYNMRPRRSEGKPILTLRGHINEK